MENEKHEQICRRLRFQTEELVKTVWSQFDCTYASRGIEMIIYLKFNDFPLWKLNGFETV